MSHSSVSSILRAEWVRTEGRGQRFIECEITLHDINDESMHTTKPQQVRMTFKQLTGTQCTRKINKTIDIGILYIINYTSSTVEGILTLMCS